MKKAPLPELAQSAHQFQFFSESFEDLASYSHSRLQEQSCSSVKCSFQRALSNSPLPLKWYVDQLYQILHGNRKDISQYLERKGDNDDVYDKRNSCKTKKIKTIQEEVNNL